MSSVGDRIAHAATPWAWRSQVAVVGLVVVGVALLAWTVVDNALRDPPVGPVAWILEPLLVVAVVTWPAVRSWRRWRAARTPAATDAVA